MFVVGHVGVTLGAARVAAWGFDFARNRFGGSERIDKGDGERLRSRLVDSLDDRAIAFGALLPDILDKPLGLILAGDLVGNSTRNVGHTLIFAIALIAAAWMAASALKRAWPIALALASAGHLALDEMWRRAETLFWPLAGWLFPQREDVSVGEWTESMLASAPHKLLDPIEMVGLAVIVYLVAKALWTRRVKTYLMTGRMSGGAIVVVSRR